VRINYLFLFLMLMAQTQAFGQSNYMFDNRSEYIQKALISILKMKRKTVRNTQTFFNVLDSSSCRSDILLLKVPCFIKFSQNNCRGKISSKSKKYCKLYSDVYISNKWSEKVFISPRKRYQIMKKHKNYRKQIHMHLKTQYADIATAFKLSDHLQCKEIGEICFSDSIDNFCRDHSDKNNYSWQYCVASLIWFIGTS